MITKDVQFQAGEELLAGRLFSTTTSDSQTGALFLHGAGRATKERAEFIALELCEKHGLPSFMFDFSGHGMSSGTMESSSLRKRITEARAALATSGFHQPITLCAFSMGGHIALELLKDVDVQALVLFYPAVYTKDAVDLLFGDSRFSTTIRRERSWEESNVFEYLRQFTGNLLVIVGENDDVIPRGVIELIMSNAIAAQRKRLVVVEDAPHLLLPMLYERKSLFDEICRTIVRFSTKS